MNSKLKLAGKLIFVIIFVVLLSHKVEYPKLKEAFHLIKYSALFSSLSFKVAGIVFSTGVLYYALDIVGVFFKPTKLFKIYSLSYFFNSLGLGSLGGDSYKWVQLNKDVHSKEKTTLALINEKIIGFSTLFAFVTISSLAYFFHHFHLYFYLLAYPLSFIFVRMFFAIFKWVTKIRFLQSFSFVKNMHEYHFDRTKQGLKTVFLSLFFSFLFYLATIFSFSVIYTSLDSVLPLWLAFFVIPIVIFINTIPISFQGIGLREASVAYLFSFLGFSFELGLTASILLLFVNIVISLLSGVYYLKEKHSV